MLKYSFFFFFTTTSPLFGIGYKLLCASQIIGSKARGMNGGIFGAVPRCSSFPSGWIMDHREEKWCPVSALSCQHRTGPDAQGPIQGLRKVGRQRDRGQTTPGRRARGEERRGETQRQSHRQWRGSWHRGVRVLFLVSPHARLQLKQLLEHLHTKRLRHHRSRRQRKHPTHQERA